MFSRILAMPFVAAATLLAGCIIVPGSSSLGAGDYGRAGPGTGSYGRAGEPAASPAASPAPAPSRDATIPVIASLTASPTNLTQPGQEVVFHIEAVDGAGTPGYTWSATGGTLTSTVGKRVAWRSPAAPGRYTVLVLVSSPSGGATTGAVNIEVHRDGSGEVLPADLATAASSSTPAPSASPCAVHPGA
ncbi:MAG: PKD domain-containing protein [Candidatus Sericytochromatia bacterium]|nr:PKD domain-containing protein [Candidatus Tanganyikabacteria bacterium]